MKYFSQFWFLALGHICKPGDMKSVFNCNLMYFFICYKYPGILHGWKGSDSLTCLGVGFKHNSLLMGALYIACLLSMYKGLAWIYQLASDKIIVSIKCDMIKQNESEVYSDMLLVSDYIKPWNIISIEFETRHLWTLQYLGLHNIC